MTLKSILNIKSIINIKLKSTVIFTLMMYSVVSHSRTLAPKIKTTKDFELIVNNNISKNDNNYKQTKTIKEKIDAIDKNFYKSSNVREYLAEVIKMTSVLFFGSCSYLFSHEMGHAIVAKMLVGSPIDIGCEWHKLTGYAKFNPKYKETTFNRILVTLAGSFFGCLSQYLPLSSWFYFDKKLKKENFGQRIKKAASKPFNLFDHILAKKYSTAKFYTRITLGVIFYILHYNRILYALFPGTGTSISGVIDPSYNLNSDGSLLWSLLTGNQKQDNLKFCLHKSYLALNYGGFLFILNKAFKTVKEYKKRKSKRNNR